MGEQEQRKEEEGGLGERREGQRKENENLEDGRESERRGGTGCTSDHIRFDSMSRGLTSPC